MGDTRGGEATAEFQSPDIAMDVTRRIVASCTSSVVAVLDICLYSQHDNMIGLQVAV